MRAPRFAARVPPELDGARLDRALAALLEDVPRTRVRELVEDGRVSVDGRPVRRPAQPVERGQSIEADLAMRDRARPGARAGAVLRVLHADGAIVVVDKPAGMVSHPSSVVRGGTVSEVCVERFGPLPAAQGEDRPGIVHRLDAETSGVMVLARTEAACAELLRQFREREVEKTYHALVHGTPRFDSDWITAPIGRDPRHPERMAAGVAGGREAETFYETLRRWEGFGLVACRPVTGRTHQVRVHLASVDLPLVGDRLYRGSGSGRLPRGAPPPERAMLHARAIALAHPESGQRVAFESDPPEDFAALADWLGANLAEVE